LKQDSIVRTNAALGITAGLTANPANQRARDPLMITARQ
jgi:hypothetical protein